MKPRAPALAVSVALAILSTALLSACGEPTTDTAARTPASKSVPLAQLPDTAQPLHYRLSLDVDPERERFNGVATIDVALNAPTRRLWMHGNKLDVEHISVVADGNTSDLDPRAFEQRTDDGVAELSFDRELVPGKYTLEFRYSAPFDHELIGLYRVRTSQRWYAVTQFEDIGARRAFPGFDEPRFKTPFDLVVTAPAGAAVAGPTPITEDRVADDKHIVTFATTPPLPTYLIALAVGPWDIRSREPIAASPLRPTQIPLRGIAVHGRGAELDVALSDTPALVLEHERYYGVGYPFAKLDLAAVPDFEPGAMENVGLITFRDVLLLHGEHPTLEQHRDFVGVLAHELAHQWFGNLVTPMWWNDLWLNESFASWAGARAADALEPEVGYRTDELAGTVRAMDQDSLAAARRLREPVANSEDIANAFDAITYSKGAGVLRMFEGYVGAEVFREAVHGYLDRYRSASATADDFIDALARTAAAPDVGGAFHSFIDRPGVPMVAVAIVCDGKQPELDLTTRRYLPLGATADEVSGWKIPFCIEYGAVDGKHDACTMLKSGEARMTLDACPTWLLPNRAGDGYYRWTLDDGAFAKLLAQYGDLHRDEQLVIADSLAAGFAAGEVSVQRLLDALPPLAGSASWHALGRVVDWLVWLHAHSTGGTRSALEQRFRTAFGARQKALAAHHEAPMDALLYDRLTSFLALRGGDEELATELATHAARQLRDLSHDPNVPHWDLLPDGLLAGVQSGRIDAQTLVAVLATVERAEVRGAVLHALGGATTVDAGRVSRTLIDSPSLRSNERLDLLGTMFDPRRAEDDWAWLKANADRLAGKLPESARQSLPLFASALCSSERASEVEAFFHERAARFRGGERSLAQAVEQIRQCAAALAHHAPDLGRSTLGRNTQPH